MKLSSLGKKEKLQILGLALIGVVAAIWACVQFLILPQNDKRKKADALTTQLEEELKKNDAEIEKASGAEDEADDIKADLREIDQKYVLKPEYDNYMISAQARVDRILAACELKVDSAGMVGQQDMPPLRKGQKSSEVMASAFVVEVRAFGNYESVLKLLEQVNNESPYFLISSLRIASAADPLAHLITFRLYWPIWKDLKTPATFEEKPRETADGKKYIQDRKR